MDLVDLVDLVQESSAVWAPLGQLISPAVAVLYKRGARMAFFQRPLSTSVIHAYFRETPSHEPQVQIVVACLNWLILLHPRDWRSGFSTWWRDMPVVLSATNS